MAKPCDHSIRYGWRSVFSRPLRCSGNPVYRWHHVGEAVYPQSRSGYCTCGVFFTRYIWCGHIPLPGPVARLVGLLGWDCYCRPGVDDLLHRLGLDDIIYWRERRAERREERRNRTRIRFSDDR